MLSQTIPSVAPTFTHKYTINYLRNCVVSPPILKADTGSTTTNIKPSHILYLTDISKLNNGPSAMIPNGTKIQAEHLGQLPIQANFSLSSLVFPDLHSESLLSIGQLCDNDCLAIFDRYHLHVFKNNRCILKGYRNTKDGLWDVPFPSPQPTVNKMSYIIRQDLNKTELAQYLHACAFSPSISTFQCAINNGNFISWPAIQSLNFKKLLGSPLPTLQGHLDQERKNLQSTKPSTKSSLETNSASHPLDIQPDDKDNFFPQKISEKTYSKVNAIIQLPHSKTYTDQTGRFPYQSSQGNNYVMVSYDYNANTILTHPIKNREASTLVEAWTALHVRLTSTGHPVSHYILDNEFSGDLRDAIKNANLTFELAPPHQHRRNAAERAI